MSKVLAYEVRTVSRPTVVMSTSYGVPPQSKEHVFVALEDENGLRGWGESTPLPEFSGETTDIVRMMLETTLLPAIVGMESLDIAWAHAKMDALIHGNNAAKMAIDTALYDLNAKRARIPLYGMLGGKLREHVPINRHIGIVETRKAEEMAAQFVAQGFVSIKMKIGLDAAGDIERVRAVRREVGDDVKLRVDANGGYDRADAIAFIRGVDACDIEIYEQLLPKHDIEGMSALRAASGFRFCADESASTPADALELARAGACDFFTIKLIKCGGIYPALKIAAIAEAAGTSCIVANTFDTQVNCSACLHLASALPGKETAHDLTCFATQPDLADTCHTLADGYLSVGPEPGIGVRSLKEFQL